MLVLVKYGVIGVVFGLATYSYRLIKAEQQRDKVRDGVLSLIKFYILFEFLIAITGVIGDHYSKQAECKELKEDVQECEDNEKKLKAELDHQKASSVLLLDLTNIDEEAFPGKSSRAQVLEKIRHLNNEHNQMQIAKKNYIYRLYIVECIVKEHGTISFKAETEVAEIYAAIQDACRGVIDSVVVNGEFDDTRNTVVSFQKKFNAKNRENISRSDHIQPSAVPDYFSENELGEFGRKTLEAIRTAYYKW